MKIFPNTHYCFNFAYPYYMKKQNLTDLEEKLLNAEPSEVGSVLNEFYRFLHEKKGSRRTNG